MEDMDRDLKLVALHHPYMHMVMDLDPGEVVAFKLDNELAQALDLELNPRVLRLSISKIWV